MLSSTLRFSWRSPIQAMATSALSWLPTSASHDLIAEGDAKAATLAARAAATSAGARDSTGTVLYVLSRLTVKSRSCKPSCRKPKPQSETFENVCALLMPLLGKQKRLHSGFSIA